MGFQTLQVQGNRDYRRLVASVIFYQPIRHLIKFSKTAVPDKVQFVELN